jgi:hypothetical protein
MSDTRDTAGTIRETLWPPNKPADVFEISAPRARGTIADRDMTEALVALYGDHLRELRADDDALAWGGLRYDAARDVLGNDASPEAIDAMLDAARTDP